MIKREIDICEISSLIYRIVLVGSKEQIEKIAQPVKKPIDRLIDMNEPNVIDFLNEVSFIIESQFSKYETPQLKRYRRELICRRQKQLMKKHPIAYFALLAELYARGVMFRSDKEITELIVRTRQEDSKNDKDALRRSVVFQLDKDNRTLWLPRHIYDYYNN